jgi:hypothetical protein
VEQGGFSRDKFVMHASAESLPIVVFLSRKRYSAVVLNHCPTASMGNLFEIGSESETRDRTRAGFLEVGKPRSSTLFDSCRNTSKHDVAVSLSGFKVILLIVSVVKSKKSC